MWKRVGLCCLYLARCRSPSLYICFDPNFGCCFPFHASSAAAAAAAALSSWQWSWDRHQAEVWPLLTEMRFVFKKCCWGIAFNISAWSNSSQLKYSWPDPAWSAKLVSALKNLVTRWGNYSAGAVANTSQLWACVCAWAKLFTLCTRVPELIFMYVCKCAVCKEVYICACMCFVCAQACICMWRCCFQSLLLWCQTV